AALAGAHVLGVDRFPLRRVAVDATGLVEATASPDDERLVETAHALSRGYGFDGGVIAFGGDGSPALKAVVSILKEAPDTHKMGRVVVVGGARIEHLFAAGLGNVDVRSSARPGAGYHDHDW